MAPDVSIVVVSYQTRDLTLAALDSIAPALNGLSAEVIVVDNASTDGSAAAVKAAHPDVDLVALQENVGFARGVNIGATRASGGYVLLLNPDAVARPGAIHALVEAAHREPEAGLWGGRVVDPEGQPDTGTARGLPTLWSLVCFATGLSSVGRRSRLFDPESLGRWDRTTPRAVGYLTGCFLLADSSAWQALGGFDERYFMYGEDADLAVRARALGYAPVFCPEATVVHRSGASTGRAGKWVLLLAGRVTFLERNWSPWRAKVGTALLVAGAGLRAAATRVAARLGRPGTGYWAEVWRRRDEWRAGYPDLPPTRGR